MVGLHAVNWRDRSTRIGYWIAAGEAKMPREAVETFAIAAWAVLRANDIEEQVQ